MMFFSFGLVVLNLKGNMPLTMMVMALVSLKVIVRPNIGSSGNERC